MYRNYIYSSVQITHIYCYSITLKMCTSNVQPMYIFAVYPNVTLQWRRWPLKFSEDTRFSENDTPMPVNSKLCAIPFLTMCKN